MRLRSPFTRRPSPAIVISAVALFMSLGGVGYAATQLPTNSVGSSQIRNEAVTFKKIHPNSVGRVRANLGQIQARVSGKCAAGSAIGTVNNQGKVTCNSAVPAQVGTTNNTATITPTTTTGSTATTPPTGTTVASVPLPAGASYLAFANPTATVVSGVNVRHMTVTCTLTVGTNTQTRSATVNTTGTTGESSSASIPFQATGPSGTASLSCTSSANGTGTPPPVSVTAAINAIAIAG